MPVMISVREEIWTIGIEPQLVRRIGVRAVLAGWDAARERAKELAAEFPERGYEQEYDYAWGREKDDKRNHRFIVGRDYSSGNSS